MLNKFKIKGAQIDAIESAYESVKQRREWISDMNENGEFIRPSDEYMAIQYDKLTDIMEYLEKLV